MSMIAAALSAAIGTWLMAAPDVLGYGDPAASVHRIAGPVAASVGVIALWRVIRAVLRANLVMGIALVASAVVTGTTGGVVNALACGMALTALAVVPIVGEDRFAGGWIGLLEDRNGLP